VRRGREGERERGREGERERGREGERERILYSTLHTPHFLQHSRLLTSELLPSAS
jgi:hypothetical protein